MKKLLRKVHRWLGLLMALQIVAWMVSGLWFSLYPIAEIRGEHLVREPERLGVLPQPATAAALADPGRIQQTLAAQPGWAAELHSMQLINRDGHFFWRVAGESQGRTWVRLVAADASAVLPQLDASAARARAQRVLLEPGQIRSVEWVEESPPGSEIRGRDLPLWKVSYDEPESLNLYIQPWTGEVVARRTTHWRVFDFLWMLHIMDFDDRDDFNHPLLQIAAFLGLVIALSGIVLWALTTRWRRRSPGRAA